MESQDSQWVSARKAQTIVAAAFRYVGVNDEVVRHTARVSILSWLHQGVLTARADPKKYRFQRQIYTGLGDTGWEDEAEIFQQETALGDDNIIPATFWWGVLNTVGPFYSFNDDPSWEFGFFPCNWGSYAEGSRYPTKGDSYWEGRVEDVEFRLAELPSKAPNLGGHTQASQIFPSLGEKGGRPPVLNWELAALEMAGRFYRGDLKPRTIADVIRAIQQWADLPDGGPPDDTIRPHARAILQAFKSWESDD